MLHRRAGIALGTAVPLALGVLGLAAENAPAARFTFAAANAAAAGPTGSDRSELVVTRWSTEEERNRVMEAVGGGPQQLSRAVAQGWDAGYTSLPGSLRHALRYAHRVPLPDGGEDIVVLTDRPIWWWWDAPRNGEASEQEFSIVHLRLNEAGVREGKLSATISGLGHNRKAKTVVLDDYASRPALLMDVRRQHG
jgi:hypothetical protein